MFQTSPCVILVVIHALVIPNPGLPPIISVPKAPSKEGWPERRELYN